MPGESWGELYRTGWQVVVDSCSNDDSSPRDRPDSGQHEYPEQVWESLRHRFLAPIDLLSVLGTSQRLVLVPRNTVEHVETRHPLDAAILDDLQEFFDRYEYVDTYVTESTRVVVYGRYKGVWRRGILAKSSHLEGPAIFVNAYRRDAVRVEKRIASGRLMRRGGEE